MILMKKRLPLVCVHKKFRYEAKFCNFQPYEFIFCLLFACGGVVFRTNTEIAKHLNIYWCYFQDFGKKSKHSILFKKKVRIVKNLIEAWQIFGCLRKLSSLSNEVKIIFLKQSVS